MPRRRLLDAFSIVLVTLSASCAREAQTPDPIDGILVIAALLHDPDLLIFDEPDSGLDVTAALVLRHLIANLAARGKAILYTSHILDVVERLCTRVIVLHEGRLVADDSVQHLRTVLASASLEEVFAQLVLRQDPETIARDIADVVTSGA